MNKVLGGLIRYAPFASQLASAPKPRLRGDFVHAPHIYTILEGYAHYAIRSTIKRQGVPEPFARVWLMEGGYPLIPRAARADAQGNYVFKPVRPSPRGYIVLGFDDTGAFDPEAKDFLQPAEEAP